MVAHLDTKNDVMKFISEAGNSLVVLDFFATWCGPCKKIAPVLEAISKEHPGVKFAKIDVDTDQDSTEHFNITGMPTFVFFKNGAELERFSGANEATLRSTIAKHQ
ncbi:unnamed protein product [Calicophoron daubneyi]|uniref:Thioredoxin n=1 Tax=Calicophoron daubneyi TaxID=300641 RepID=A0AAV2T7S3_CALDB